METTQRARRTFTDAFKAEVVAAAERGDRTIPEICAEYDVGQTSVRKWVRDSVSARGADTRRVTDDVDSDTQWTLEEAQAVITQPHYTMQQLTLEKPSNGQAPEDPEVTRLRQENQRLAQDVDILKRALLVFARETWILE